MNSVKFVVAALVATAPLACFAGNSPAVDNCARAAANALHAQLRATSEIFNRDYPVSQSGRVDNQMIVTARLTHGSRHGEYHYVCTYDRQGDVTSLRRPAPVDNVPAVDGTDPNVPGLLR